MTSSAYIEKNLTYGLIYKVTVHVYRNMSDQTEKKMILFIFINEDNVSMSSLILPVISIVVYQMNIPINQNIDY